MIAAAFFVSGHSSADRKCIQITLRQGGEYNEETPSNRECIWIQMSSANTSQRFASTVSSPSREHTGLTKLLVVCLLVPSVLIGFVMAMSPNFNEQNLPAGELRADPIGADILQDYVGGHLWTTDREKLYDWSHSAALQHDADLIGFEWQESGYFPMVYPPFHYQFAGLGTGLKYRQFVVIQMCAIALSLSIAAFAFLAGYREIRMGAAAWLFVAILFTPLLLGINMGQKSGIILSILTVSFVLLHREKPFAAGIVFGLIAFKPYMALPIGIAMLFKKQFYFVAGSLISLAFLMGGSLIFSPDTWREYIEVCLGMGDYVSINGYQLEHSHSLWGTMQLMFGDLNPTLVKPFAVVAAIGVITLLGRILSGPMDTSSTRFAYQFSALVIATVLISPHFNTYDLTILLLPLAICGLSIKATRRMNQRLMYWICISVLFGASLYVPIAASFGFQISTVILLAWLAVIAGGWGKGIRHTLAKC